MAHHLTTGGWTKFHGHNRDGAFQTGKGEHVRLWSIHEIAQTGVNFSRQDLVDDGLLSAVTLAADNPITIQGTEYTTNLAFDDAQRAQSNLDIMLQAFSELGTIVDVVIGPAVNTAADPAADFATVFLGGADTFGSDVATDTNIWRLDVRFEQKGMYTNVPGTAGFVRGEPSIALTADNFGSSVADIHAILNFLVLTATTLDIVGVDDSTETNNESRLDDAPQIAGSLTNLVGATSADAATSQTIVVEVQVHADLQS